MRTAYINLYHSGFYHRSGKPGQYNVHPGDLYPTRKAAEEDIDPAAPYIATVLVSVPDEVCLGDVNPSDSKPTPLSDTRAIYDVMGKDDLVAFNQGELI